MDLTAKLITGGIPCKCLLKVVLFVITLGLLKCEELTCPRSDAELYADKSVCYWYIPGSFDYTQAKKICEADNGHLATLYDAPTSEFVINTVFDGDCQKSYLGITRNTGGEWVTWDSVITPWANWATIPAQYPSGPANCVRFGGGCIWRNRDCTELLGALCESEGIPVTTVAPTTAVSERTLATNNPTEDETDQTRPSESTTRNATTSGPSVISTSSSRETSSHDISTSPTIVPLSGHSSIGVSKESAPANISQSGIPLTTVAPTIAVSESTFATNIPTEAETEQTSPPENITLGDTTAGPSIFSTNSRSESSSNDISTSPATTTQPGTSEGVELTGLAPASTVIHASQDTSSAAVSGVSGVTPSTIVSLSGHSTISVSHDTTAANTSQPGNGRRRSSSMCGLTPRIRCQKTNRQYSIQSMYKLNKKGMSKDRRRYYSATDDRTSCTAMGVVGVLVICIIGCLFISLDISTFITQRKHQHAL